MGRRTQARSTITIRDVAKASGCSPTTVSLVLNDAPLARYIPDETKGRIQNAATTLGYRPNVYARFLRSNRSHTIGLMVFDITDPFCTPIIGGIQNVLYPASHLSILTDVQNEHSRFERSLEMLFGSCVDGLLIVANWVFLDLNFLADLVKSKMPTVMIARGLEMGAVTSVKVDNRAGGFAALNHLYSKGHRRVAFIRGPKGLSDSTVRWSGIVDFANSRSLTINPSLVVDLPESRTSLCAFDSALNLTRDLLRKRHSFTAILAFDDISAMGAMRALAEAGLRVPQECSVIGFDDISFAELCAPSLTTVRQPLEMMGRVAASLLLERLAERDHHSDIPIVHRTVVPDIVERESVAKPCSSRKISR